MGQFEKYMIFSCLILEPAADKDPKGVGNGNAVQCPQGYGGLYF